VTVCSFLVFSSLLVQIASADVDLKARGEKSLKCAACSLTVAGLKEAWQRTSTKKHLDIDMRSRIDPSGKRLGKKVPYLESEVRYHEVAEDACDARPSARYLVLKEGALRFSSLNETETEAESVRSFLLGQLQSNDDTATADDVDEEEVKKRLTVVTKKVETEERGFSKRHCEGLMEEYEMKLVNFMSKHGEEAVPRMEEKLCYKWSADCVEGGKAKKGKKKQR